MSERYIGGLVYNPPGGWSGSFNGSSQYLTLPSGSAFAFGTGDFTVECFVYINSFPSNPNSVYFVDARNSSQTGTWAFLTSADGTDSTRFDWYTGSGVISGSKLTASTWLHLVYTRSSSTYGMFVNGVRVATGTDSTNYSTSPTTSYIASRFNATNLLNGYMSNLRVVKGSSVYSPSSTSLTVPTGALLPITNTVLLTCRYPTFVDGSASPITLTNVGTATVSTTNPFPTSVLPNPALGGAGNGIYTLSQYASLLGAGTWPAYDPYFKNVTMMLHGDGTNGGQNNTFLDSSTNNFTITRNGNTTQGTFTPYGSNWSNYFDGSGDYLTAPSNAAFALGTGDYTFETWIYKTTSVRVSIVATSGGSGFGISINTSGNIEVCRAGVAIDFTFTASITNNTWTHIAVTRSGTSLMAFKDGVLLGTQTSSTNYGQGTFYVAIDTGGTGDTFAGYMSNLRLIKGTAVYTSAFTPSTTPLTAITNTSLLTCQSNRFIDNSTNAFAITKNGDTSVQRFSPFSPSTAYSTSVIGGSGYFDGSGDYLQAASNAAFALSGDFTINAWIYPTSTSRSTISSVGNGIGGIAININTSGNIEVCRAGTAIDFTFTANIKINQWSYVTVIRSGTNMTAYLNGTSLGTQTNATSYAQSYLNVGIDGDGTSYPFVGYIASYQMVKGTAIVPSAGGPTAPLTAIANTSLLCNFTNAAILDNAMMNDLETVGNAQISTSVKKYGTGSMYFDGTDDRLNMPSSPNLAFGTGDFTLEMWAYFTSTANFPTLTDSRVNTSSTAGFNLGLSSAKVQLYTTSQLLIGSSTLSANTWYHIAITRASGTLKIWLNGTQDATVSNSTNWSDQSFVVGATPSAANFMTGYIDDLRITKGYARYTANFTPPTSQVQDQ